MPKRGREGNVLAEYAPGQLVSDLKRFRTSPEPFIASSEQYVCCKRPATFDTEIRHMNKRLRATIPTAEEAIAFLLPHITKLSHLYNESVAENRRLKACSSFGASI